MKIANASVTSTYLSLLIKFGCVKAFIVCNSWQWKKEKFKLTKTYTDTIEKSAKRKTEAKREYSQINQIEWNERRFDEAENYINK